MFSLIRTIATFVLSKEINFLKKYKVMCNSMCFDLKQKRKFWDRKY
jgi:hypothetical protein